MPRVFNKKRKVNAVLWTATGVEEGGRQTVKFPPYQLKVRWEQVKRTSEDSKGNPILIELDLLTDRAIPSGSLVWRGTIAQLPGTSYAAESDLYKVESCDEIPDVTERHVLYSVLCSRFADRMAQFTN